MPDQGTDALSLYRTRLRDSLPAVQGAIVEAAHRAGRDPDGVRLVAVTKGHDLSAAEAALDMGLIDLGENRIEEIERKSVPLVDRLPRWHLIGHLQGRKAGRVQGRVELFHALDSLRLAERLAGSQGEGKGVLPVLLQVNVSGEESKGGFAPDEVERAIPSLLELGKISVEGLMTMAPFTTQESVIRRTFRGLRELQERLETLFPAYQGRELSMGMSNDYEIAVEEGSTLLRLGTVLFGERPA